MDRRTKIIVITATLILWALVGSIIGGGIYLAKKYEGRIAEFEEKNAVFRKAFEAEGIISGGELFSKTILNEEVFISNITDIRITPKTPFSDGEIILAGSDGAVFLDWDDPSVVNSSVYFEEGADFVKVIDIEGDGLEEFMGRGCWCKPPIVIDSAGDTLWKYEKTGDKVIDMVAADMDGDGELEFIAGLRDGGIRIIDINDKKFIKKETMPVRHVEVADADGDGRLDIIFTTADEQFMVTDSSGKWLKILEEENIKVKDFTLVARSGVDGEGSIISADEGVVRFHDLFGRVVKEVSFERAYGSADIRGVSFGYGGADAYTAVLLVYKLSDNFKRSVLVIFDESLSIVYEEVFEGLYYAIATEPYRGGATAETLLIGGQGGLIRYALVDGADVR